MERNEWAILRRTKRKICSVLLLFFSSSVLVPQNSFFSHKGSNRWWMVVSSDSFLFLVLSIKSEELVLTGHVGERWGLCLSVVRTNRWYSIIESVCMWLLTYRQSKQVWVWQSLCESITLMARQLLSHSDTALALKHFTLDWQYKAF